MASGIAWRALQQFMRDEKREENHFFQSKNENDFNISHGWLIFDFFLEMILPQVHLRKPCYDFYFL